MRRHLDDDAAGSGGGGSSGDNEFWGYKTNLTSTINVDSRIITNHVNILKLMLFYSIHSLLAFAYTW